MSNYKNWQLQKHGNYVGSDGLLHTADTNHMVDNLEFPTTPEEFENGFFEAEQFERRSQQINEIQILNFQ